MKAKEWFARAGRFVRSYTDGMAEGGVQQLFDRDAREAYAVVTREHAGEDEPESGFWRLVHRARILLLSLSFRLSPPRRLVFAVCVALAAWSIVDVTLGRSTVLHPALLAFTAFAGLVFLLLLELADRVVVRDELEVARQLQRELLPELAPEVPGYRFAFSYRTANTIGGDYYGFLPLADGRLVVVMGDASGHGIAAGLIMAVASSTLGLAFDDGDDPAAAARLVNRALCRVGDRRAFMTLCCGVLEPASGHLRLVTAGHPYPLLRAADGSISELGSGALPLGIRRDLELEVHETVVGAGNLVLLSTDGVVETLNPAGASYGFERLREVLAAGGGCREVHDRVMDDVDAFRGDEPLHDDRSLMVIERLA